MASIDTAQRDQVTFLNSLTSGGAIAPSTFWAWNFDSPVSYNSGSLAFKWGDPSPGRGAVIGYRFDTLSAWSEPERQAFSASFSLWSAITNVIFNETQAETADITITRTEDDLASTRIRGVSRTPVGSINLETPSTETIGIDTSVRGYGPIGAPLSEYGAQPWGIILHEIGHTLGLGHGGPYNDGESSQPRGPYDSETWTIMAYHGGTRWGVSQGANGSFYNSPSTWRPLDIIAVQQLYGVAIDTPLSGGQVYGFNSNISGEIRQFFDFTQNVRPVVTLWNKGTNNTLDLTGYGSNSNVDLSDGGFSSVGGLNDNLVIAYGTRIDTLLLGAGYDTVRGNDNSNVIMGAAGDDSIRGGEGNDHLYGAGTIATPGDGSDTIVGGGGSDYIQGNAGDDRVFGGFGSDRIQGGQGNDMVNGEDGNDSANGNLGNDGIEGGNGNDSLRGGQGNDGLGGGEDNDMLFGDLGSDTLQGGAGLDLLTGGGGNDVFHFAATEAVFSLSGSFAGMTDAIIDFTIGADRIDIFQSAPSAILHDMGIATFEEAAAIAHQALRAQTMYNKIDVIGVGADTYIFYLYYNGAPLEAIKLVGFANPGAITLADFI